jgi:hypothetical protein
MIDVLDAVFAFLLGVKRGWAGDLGKGRVYPNAT